MNFHEFVTDEPGLGDLIHSCMGCPGGGNRYINYPDRGGLPFVKTGIKLKHFNMKKLAFLMIMASFAACGSGTSTSTTDSTTVVKKDTMTMSATDTTHTLTVDSTKKTTDSTKK